MGEEQFAAGKRLNRKIVERKGRKPTQSCTLIELDEIDEKG
jgi:hypothetical protein